MPFLTRCSIHAVIIVRVDTSPSVEKNDHRRSIRLWRIRLKKIICQVVGAMHRFDNLACRCNPHLPAPVTAGQAEQRPEQWMNRHEPEKIMKRRRLVFCFVLIVPIILIILIIIIHIIDSPYLYSVENKYYSMKIYFLLVVKALEIFRPVFL